MRVPLENELDFLANHDPPCILTFNDSRRLVFNHGLFGKIVHLHYKVDRYAR